MDFIYLFRVILKRKWIIIGAVLVAALTAYILTRKEEKSYRSVAQVSTGFTVSDEIKVGNENFSFYEADTKFNNAIVTSTSPTVISLLSYTLILHDLENSAPFRRLTEKQQQSTLYKSINKTEAKRIFGNKLESMSLLTSFNPTEKNLIELLNLYGYDNKSILKNLNVYRLQRTDYIQIEFSSANPELSAFVVNTIFQQFLRYYKNVRSNKSQESIDTLQSLVVKKKQDLDAKNAALKGEGVVDASIENTSKFALIGNLENTLTAEKNKQTKLNYDLQKVTQKLSSLKETKVPENTSNSNNDEIILLRRAMNEAYSAYLNSGSSDQALLKKFNSLKAQYNSKVANTPGSKPAEIVAVGESKAELTDKKNDIELDIQATNDNIANIQSKINSLKGNVVQDASKNAYVETLLKEAELANKEYLDAKQKYNDATDINSSSVNNFRQILVGQPAIEAEPSKRALIIGMAGASALIATLFIIVILTYLDSSIKTPEIFSRVVNLKMISMVNFMNFKNRDIADIVTTNKDHIDDPNDKQRLNVFRESLRKLRYEIEKSGKKTFLFTSTNKGQGKTTLILALSYSMSLSKKKILIIDTNFCNNDLTVKLDAFPVLEKINPDNSSNKALLDQVKDASKDVGGGSVFIIGSEGGDYTPSEILPRENLLQHLNTLTQEYDYIFLEGPPLNDYSDSKELAKYVEGVIVIFSATHIIKQIDKESITFFDELNGKFCGSILNKVDLENVNVT